MGNTINIQQLNVDFGLDNQVEFVAGKGGLPCILINNAKASALISVYAGQVLSYKPVSQATDLMFISDNAHFQAGKATKGGIPICWPWFGAAPDPDNKEHPKKPDHGFVRNSYWSVVSTGMLENGDTKIILEYHDSEQTHAMWPYCFYLSLEIVIGDSLTLELQTKNTGSEAFYITEALHAYFSTGDITQIKISGLEGTSYLDKNKNFALAYQQDVITISEATDHIHSGVNQDLMIQDNLLQRRINISSSGNKSVVVWNPWIEGSGAIKDLDKEDYKHFICVEIANAGADFVEILPDNEHTLEAKYSIS